MTNLTYGRLNMALRKHNQMACESGPKGESGMILINVVVTIIVIASLCIHVWNENRLEKFRIEFFREQREIEDSRKLKEKGK